MSAIAAAAILGQHGEIDDDAVPGTVHLVDLDHTMATLHAGKGDIVLVPTPSDDPDDPLNWSPRRKMMSTVCVSVYITPSKTDREMY